MGICREEGLVFDQFTRIVSRSAASERLKATSRRASEPRA
jgi:hypothetical protein